MCHWCRQYTLGKSMNDFIKERHEEIRNTPINENNSIGTAIIRLMKTGKSIKQTDINDIILKELCSEESHKIVTERHIDNLLKQKCTFCGEDLNPWRINWLEDTDKIIEYGYELYEEFKGFMQINGERLPKEIIIEIAEEDYTGVCKYDGNLGKFRVGIDVSEIGYFHNLRKYFFHEFTHVLQGINYDGSIIPKEKKNKHIWYHEFEASEIEMMAMLGFENVNENKKLRLSKKVICDNYVTTVKDFLETRANICVMAITALIESNASDIEFILSIIRNMMYFRGFVNFCKRYLDKDSIEIMTKGNEIEMILCERLTDEDNELPELLNQLDKHFENYNNIRKETITNIMNKIFYVLLYNNVAEYKSQKKILQLKVKHNLI